MIPRVAAALFALWAVFGCSLSRGDALSTARVGYLGVSEPNVPVAIVELWKRLRELGWEEGRNLAVEKRWAVGRVERFPALIDELVARNVDVIVTGSTPAALAAKRVTKTIPIVAWGIGDPVGTGLAQSLARPGGNLTGLSYAYTQGFAGKWLELLQDCVPHLKSVAVILNPQNSWAVQQRNDFEAGAASLKLQLQFVELSTAESLQPSFDKLRRNGQAAIVLGDPFMFHHRLAISSLAMRHRLPILTTMPEFADAGALMAYGVDNNAVFRRLAEYVDKILRGAKPEDLPIEQPTQFTLVVNLKTAKTLGLNMPQSLLARSDRVIR
jgi:putative ABC transport system substrate-binding protein